MSNNSNRLRLVVRHSSAQQDVALADELLAHLDPLERLAGVTIWSEARSLVGSDWREEIQRAIDQADVALLLLSVDFFASKQLMEVDLPRIWERVRAGELRVIPVLLRSCSWRVEPWFKEVPPLPRSEKPIAASIGEERDAVLSELATEILRLTDGSPREAAAPFERQAARTAPVATSVHGSSTFHINIHNSTVGSMAVGDGALANGRVDLRSATEERLSYAIARAPDSPGRMPLVLLGPHLIAEGERVAASGHVWTVRLHRFLLGDDSSLSHLSDSRGNTSSEDSFIVLSDPGEGRSISGSLSWRKERDCIEVQVPVAAPYAKRPVTGLEDIDLDSLAPVQGVKAAVTKLTCWLGTPYGMIERGVGCLIPDWMVSVDLKSRVQDLLRVEILRLSCVPRIDDYSTKAYVPLGFVERVISVHPRMDEADAEMVPVEFELAFVGGGVWRGVVEVTLRKADPEAAERATQALLEKARGLK